MVDGRPFAGAWIETSSDSSNDLDFGVAPSRGRGLKLPDVARELKRLLSPLRGGVD